jgi:hypothetical protein
MVCTIDKSAAYSYLSIDDLFADAFVLGIDLAQKPLVLKTDEKSCQNAEHSFAQ